MDRSPSNELHAWDCILSSRLARHHSTGGLASPASMSPPETPPRLRTRGATEGGNEATKLLLPLGPLSAASSTELTMCEIGEQILPQLAAGASQASGY